MMFLNLLKTSNNKLHPPSTQQKYLVLLQDTPYVQQHRMKFRSGMKPRYLVFHQCFQKFSTIAMIILSLPMYIRSSYQPIVDGWTQPFYDHLVCRNFIALFFSLAVERQLDVAIACWCIAVKQSKSNIALDHKRRQCEIQSTQQRETREMWVVTSYWIVCNFRDGEVRTSPPQIIRSWHKLSPELGSVYRRRCWWKKWSTSISFLR